MAVDSHLKCMILLSIACRAHALVATHTSGAMHRSWSVTLRRGAETHQLDVRESEPVLVAAEKAGLLPASSCRRGNCLSCAARVIDGAPFSLQVDENTALCEEAHSEGLVLLCSAYACGPGLVLEVSDGPSILSLLIIQSRRSHSPIEPLIPHCKSVCAQLDQDWRAWEIQYKGRFCSGACGMQHAKATSDASVHFQIDELRDHLERCRTESSSA